jgi:hypothetical protein
LVFLTKGSFLEDRLTPKIRELIAAALNVVDDQGIDLKEYDTNSDGFIDSVTFVHSGYGAEWGGTDQNGQKSTDRIWSHKSTVQWKSKEGVKVDIYHLSTSLFQTSGSKIAHIGVVSHEIGHSLGLEDLYEYVLVQYALVVVSGAFFSRKLDFFYISSTDGDGFGIGSWGLMANPWGFDSTQLYPPHLCAYSKILLGWLTPKEAEYGTNFVSALSILEPKHSQVIKISSGFPEGEYLLVENRQPLGFDRKVPDGGLVIFHIDEKAASFTQGYPGQKDWPTNGKHYQIAVLQADGAYELEQKINRGGGNDTFRKGYIDSLLPSTNVNSGPFPNTDAYQGGKVYPTTNAITSISRSNTDMSFIFTNQSGLLIFLDPELQGTKAPSSPP